VTPSKPRLINPAGETPPQYPAAKVRLTYNEKFSILRSSKRAFLSTQLNLSVDSRWGAGRADAGFLSNSPAHSSPRYKGRSGCPKAPRTAASYDQ